MAKPHKNTPWLGWQNGTDRDPVKCFIEAFVRPAGPEPAQPAPDSTGETPTLFLPGHVIPRSAWGLGPRKAGDESNPEGA